MNTFIEFIERFDRRGIASVSVVCRDLPAGYSCRIYRDQNGRYVRRTRAFGNGSIRRCLHVTLDSALKAGEAWVRRKVAEEAANS